MDTELLHLLRVSIRVTIITITNISMQVYVTNVILKRKHSFWGLGMMTAEKVIIQVILIHTILTYYYAGEKWLIAFNSIILWTHAVVAYAAFCWTFDADILKVAVITGAGEIPISFLGGMILACANLLEGKEDVWTMSAEFQLLDLLIPVLEISLTVLSCWVLRPYLKKLGEHKIVHRKIWWATFITYVAGASMTQYSSWKTLELVNYFEIGYYFLMVAVAIFLVRRHSQNTRREQEFLKVQQNLMEVHYFIVQDQIQKMEKNQKIIDRQMEEIQNLDTIESANIASYLEQLKSNYAEIRAGIYCSDWMVDALLCSQERAFSQKGMKLDCRMQGYNRGMIEEKDVVQVLTILLEYAAKASESDGETGENEVILQAARVKNQLVMELNVKEGRKVKFPELKMNPYIRMYSGNVMILHNEKNIRIVVMMKIDELSIKGTDSDQFFNFSKNALTRT